MKLSPTRKFTGTVALPGDKSIGHRAALLSLLSSGPIMASNFPDGEDCQSSVKAAEALGVSVTRDGSTVTFTPTSSFDPAATPTIDCGNSGTTARLLAGILAGRNRRAALVGDTSLSARPMKRILQPLAQMGAVIYDTQGRLPLTVEGGSLLPLEYTLPVPSAQVKSSLMLAAIGAGCSAIIREPIVTRDHTELMAMHLGTGVSVRDVKPVAQPDPIDPRRRVMVMAEPFKREISVAAGSTITGGTVDIPGDISSAAFFMAGAAIGKSELVLKQVGINPTRTAILDHLKSIGVTVTMSDKLVVANEARATISIKGGPLKARKLSGQAVAAMIDEIPIVAVMAAFAEGTTVIRDAAELRVKETDRLAAIAHNLESMGAKCGLLEDGLAIEGSRSLQGADFKSFGDHRIAMAFSIAALFVEGPSTLDDPDCVRISFPTFFELLESVTR